VKRGEKLCALVRRQILNHHFIVRRQGPRAHEQYIHRQFEALSSRRLWVRVRHLRDKRRRTPATENQLERPRLSS
jgi:hypothetical protein